jgi:hypothetical protein
MVSNIRRSAIAGIGFAVALAWASSSFAEDNTDGQAEPAPGITETRTFGASSAVVERGSSDAPEEGSRRNSASSSKLLLSGFITFGLAYIPSVMTANTSGIAVDQQLYVPVAGPWIDLATRPNCGPGSMSCSTETANQALLIADGFFQGLAVIQVLAGLAALGHDAMTAEAAPDDKPAVRVSPAQVGREAYGLAAMGQF